MMRFQRVSQDCLPVSNGKMASTIQTFTSSTEGKSFGLRSLSRDRDYRHRDRSLATTGIGYSGGDVLLQWGQRRRARVSRIVTDEFNVVKARNKSVEQNPRGSMAAEKNSAPAAIMSPPPVFSVNGRVGNLMKECFGAIPSISRNSEDPSGAATRPPFRNTSGSSRDVSRSAGGKRCPPTPEKADKKMPRPKANGSDHRQAEQEAGNNNTAPAEKPNVEVVEWPRIYIALSKKEKEDDFLAMKGTKLPQRPKKRSKNVDKGLQYCFPGMWLSDLTKSRYEVREKKCAKKQKRNRGLKGMDSMDSESE